MDKQGFIEKLYGIRNVFIPVHWFYSCLAKLSRRYALHVHKMLGYINLLTLNRDHSYYDHYIDLYTWSTGGAKRGYPKEPHWVERGVYNLLAIQYFEQPMVLELCCGDGFNTKYFYSASSKKILACDFDKAALLFAKKNNDCPNIVYRIADIKINIPEKVNDQFPTNVIWDASMIYFDIKEIDNVLRRINNVLKPTHGILSGMVSAGVQKGKSIITSFEDKASVYEILSKRFANVITWETKYATRKSVFFMASDGRLPLNDNKVFMGIAETAEQMG